MAEGLLAEPDDEASSGRLLSPRASDDRPADGTVGSEAPPGPASMRRALVGRRGDSELPFRRVRAVAISAACLAAVGFVGWRVARHVTGSPAGGGAAENRVVNGWAHVAQLEEDMSNMVTDFNYDHLDVGWKVYVTSQTGHNRICTIIGEKDGSKLHIHYDSFTDAFDEWLPRDSQRIIAVVKTTTLTTTSTTVTRTTTTVSSTSSRTSTTRTTTTSTSSTRTSTSTTTPRRYSSLFCFTLTKSSGPEIELLRLQLARGFGIFDCDAQMVFSDVSTWLSNGPTYLRGQQQQMMITTVQVPVSFANVTMTSDGRATASWVNARDYMECWRRIVEDTRFLWHDWVVKVDPDTVFVPGRLRERLRPVDIPKGPLGSAAYFRTCKTTPRKCVHTVTMSRRYGPQWSFHTIGTSADRFIVDAACSLESDHGQDCQRNGWGAGVHVITDLRGRKVSEGNCCNENEKVENVQSYCPQQQTESPEPGLSGALEVISRDAVKAYAKDGHQCQNNGYAAVGEEFFMQECLEQLRVANLDGVQLLSDEFCGGSPKKCQTAEVAFHPFRSPESYMECVGNAFMNLDVTELHQDLLHVPHADG
uniref:Uncharacterized protein n=2 Tax=Zooxanthella nutricula TaxID=1333877 RepID=A0A6V0BTI6_9DINO|mmetsp:Transcript_70947/g.217436  ORF Transcript_70947/g.217436 Transcript_70947/m.217436 type:complete len:590 (+) Transcript_70947:88-1857(+)